MANDDPAVHRHSHIDVSPVAEAQVDRRGEVESFPQVSALTELADGVKALTRMLAPPEITRVTPAEVEIYNLRYKNEQLTTYCYVMVGILLLIFLVARK